MVYTVIINGRSYDLPKKTVTVMTQLDEVLKVDALKISAVQKFEKLHKFVKEILGEENAVEVLGAEDLNDIDLSELSLAVLKINDAYEQPLTDYRTDKMREKLATIPTEKIVSLTNSVQAMNTQKK